MGGEPVSDQPRPPEDEPFDPFKPPPPGQPPAGQQPYYGQPPPGQQPYYGQLPQGPPSYGAGPPPPPGAVQGYGHQHGYPSAYPAPEKQSSRPLWLGALAGLVLVGGTFFVGVAQPDLYPWLALGAALAVIIMLIAPATRRWGLGILIGAALSLPVGMIVLAGVCIVLITGYSGGNP